MTAMTFPISESRILLIGCGKMGEAMLAGWKKNHPSLSIAVVDRHFPDADCKSAHELTGSFHAVVVATRPQNIETTLQDIKHLVAPDTLILSVAAGKQISLFESVLGHSQPIVRAMPNVAVAIGLGTTGMCANSFVTSLHKHLAELLMSSFGLAKWVNEESLMDVVTAVSGSGLAYVFHMIEALAAAGVAAGLPTDLSMTLARQTVIGGGALAGSMPDSDAATLRQNVTSPGGTTEAALKILMADNGLADLMTRAVEAATKRGQELAN